MMMILVVVVVMVMMRLVMMLVMIIVVMMHSQQGPITPYPPQNSILEDDEHLVVFLFEAFQIDRLRCFLNVNYFIISVLKISSDFLYSKGHRFK